MPMADNLQTAPNRHWAAEDILTLSRSYQGAAVLAAAADLDLFQHLASTPKHAAELAKGLKCDLRGLTVLLDALAALSLLQRSDGSQSVLAMAQHQANCLRNWAQLARVVKTGLPASRVPSVRGEAGDQAAFIGAMHNLSAPKAGQVIQALQPLEFKHLLDLGGASGTWTMAFLHACPTARATLFDLPQVVPMARQRFTAAGLADRVQLVALSTRIPGHRTACSWRRSSPRWFRAAGSRSVTS